MVRVLLVFFAFTFAAAINVSAQFTKGQKMLGASLGSVFFNSGKYDYSYTGGTPPFISRTDNFGVSLSPEFGWFLTNKLVVGGRLTAGYSQEKASDEENGSTFRKRTTSEYITMGGVFARYYFEGKQLIPFAQLNIDAGVGNSKLDGFNYTTTYKETYDGKSTGGFVFKPSFTLGATRMVNQRVGLDLFAGYIYTSQKKDNVVNTQRDIGFDGSIDEASINTTSNRFSNHGFTVGAGFRIFL